MKTHALCIFEKEGKQFACWFETSIAVIGNSHTLGKEQGWRIVSLGEQRPSSELFKKPQ